MTLTLARPLGDRTIQGHWEQALAVRAAEDPAIAGSDWGQDRIFVSVAAYRDRECHLTLQDLFAKATRPERITVGLVWQIDPETDAACLEPPVPRPGQVRTLTFDWREGQGVCWARFLAQGLWRGEEYFLQIDSHMRFEQGWDETAILELASCPSKKPLLACNPPPYTPPMDLASTYPGILRTDGFLDDGAIRFTGVWLPEPAPYPLRSPFLMANSIFASSRFIEEVPYDPYLNFENEESSLAIRAFTHGWDVYCPAQCWLWHRCINHDPHPRPLFFTDMARVAHATAMAERNRRAFRRFNHLTRHAPTTDPMSLLDLDLFGLGTDRSFAAFEDYTGLDFRTKRASEHALRARFIEDLDRIVRFHVPVLDGGATWKPKLMPEGERKLRARLRGLDPDVLVVQTIELMARTARQESELEGAHQALKVKEALVGELVGVLRDAIGARHGRVPAAAE